jgi:hypothetical protein
MTDSNQQFKVNLFPYIAVIPDKSNDDSETVGVCFSGGGSRALSAALGQLRGLTHLKLINKTDFISGVSGGAWASSVYSYVPESIREDDLLGEVCTDPQDLTWCQHKKTPQKYALDYLTENNIGRLPQGLGVAKFTDESIKMLENKIPADQIWIRLVGRHIFKPYGLYTGYGTSKYFSKDRAWFNNKIKCNNSDLIEDDFYYFPRDRYRPNLLVYGCLIPDEKHCKHNLLPVEFSPFQSGVMAQFKNTGQYQQDIGGGGIDSFAFNSDNQKYAGENLQTVDAPKNHFSLHDMVGISSSFFAEHITVHEHELDGLIPEYSYWPVFNSDTNKAQKYGYADGGNMDNSGVASMLRQNLQNIISFLNTEIPLKYDHKLKLVVVDNQVPPLFGFQPYTKGHGYVPFKDGVPAINPDNETFRGNHVFEQARFEQYLSDLWKNSQSGGTALSYQEKLSVCENPKYGVSKGIVNILWVYNNKVDAWSKNLKTSVKFWMKLQFWHYLDFPNYPTINLGLNERQVNLLAHLSCWNVISENKLASPEGLTNVELFKKIYAKKPVTN